MYMWLNRRKFGNTIQTLETYTIDMKLIVIGDSRVGKTNLVNRYCNNDYMKTYIPTIGIEYNNKHIHKNDFDVKVHIFDSAGQARYRTNTSVYYKAVDAVMLTYDATNISSFDNLEYWTKEIDLYCNHPIVILVGCKCDLIGDREVVTNDAIRFAKKHNYLFRESTNRITSINDPFVTIIDQYIHERDNDNDNDNNRLNIDQCCSLL